MYYDAICVTYLQANNQWWGTIQGNYAARNAHAKSILFKIVSDASWINAHMLPHNVPVCARNNNSHFSASKFEKRMALVLDLSLFAPRKAITTRMSLYFVDFWNHQIRKDMQRVGSIEQISQILLVTISYKLCA